METYGLSLHGSAFHSDLHLWLSALNSRVPTCNLPTHHSVLQLHRSSVHEVKFLLQFCFPRSINYIFAKVKYTHFNMSNNTKEPHIHTHPSAPRLALASQGPGPRHLSGTRLLLQTHRGLSPPLLCPSFCSQKDTHVCAAATCAFSVLKQ